MGTTRAPGRVEEFSLDLCEDYVKDFILTSDSQDISLLLIIDMIVRSKNGNIPVFPSIIEEPYFFGHYLRRWVDEGLDEKLIVEKAKKNLVSGERPD